VDTVDLRATGRGGPASSGRTPAGTVPCSRHTAPAPGQKEIQADGRRRYSEGLLATFAAAFQRSAGPAMIIGGGPRILRRRREPWRGDAGNSRGHDFAQRGMRHPRTSVGFSRDQSTLSSSPFDGPVRKTAAA